MAERKHLLHVKSSQLNGESNGPKLPTADQIEYGELAVNYANGHETISLKNSDNQVVTFSSDKQNEAKFASKERVAEIDETTSKTFDVMNTSCGFNEEIAYLPQNNLIKDAKSLSEAIEKIADGLEEANATFETKTRVAEFDVVNKSCGFNEKMTYIPQNELIQGTTSLAEAIEKVAEKANSGVDTSTLATKQELTDGLAAKQDKGDYALKTELPTIVQATGTSETDVISQKIVTDELNKKIEDAPSDGRKYARMNGEWVRIEDNLAIIEIDQTISDPATMISGDVNGDVIQWIRQNSHRVLAKKTGDGTVTYIELDDNNSNLYAADGTAAATDGSEGDVFVKLPTFYYRGNDTNKDGSSGDNVEIKFSKEPFEDCVEWNTNTLIGAYEAYHNGGKLYSRSDVESSGNISQADFKSYAAARGSGYQLVDWQMHCVLGCLFYAMYGNTNSQAICGSGTNSYTKQCGETNSLGMNDTKAETNGNTMSINFWGLENWWGNKYEWIEGIESTAENTVQILSPDPSNGRSFTWYSGSVYGKHYRFGKYLDLSSDITESGSDSTYYCDYNYGPGSLSHVVRRSSSNAVVAGGVSYANALNDSSGTNAEYGSRLAFRGVASKADSVEAFISLPMKP